MITVTDLSMSFGARVLFDRVTMTFRPGERYGLTGPNGSGKSTFLSVLIGDLEPTAGSVQRPRRVGFLRQDHFRFEEERIRDTVLMGNEALWRALVEKEELLKRSDHLTEAEGLRLGEIEGTIAEEDGYLAEAEATELLEGLGIPEARHGEPLSTLTGGDKLRVLLAQALFGKPDGLLLDEPTNALDISSIRWLENFLRDFTGTLVVISHDRHFLNAVCTRIADIDYETIIDYPGDYDDMIESKAEARSSLELANAARENRISSLQEFVQRFRAGSRASQVKSREKQLEKERKALTDLKRSNIQRPFIRFEQKRASGKQVLSVENVSKRFERAVICEDFNLSVMRGDKVAIVGPNGIGKTSMLRLFNQELRPDSGNVNWGYEASVGYMPQDHGEHLDKSDKTAHAWVREANAAADEEQVRALFGRMLFSKDEPLKPVRVLSGGETVRLLLVRLMLLQPNVLLLDEPTNHLDLEAIRALTDGLAQFQGTCVFVTHDRQMVSRVATRVLELSDAGIRELSPDQFDRGEFLLKYNRYKRAS